MSHTRHWRHLKRDALYQDRIDRLSFHAATLAASMILASQFIFFNLHYVVGGTLTVTALLSWLAQFCVNVVEWRRLKRGDFVGLSSVLDAHFYLNRAFQFIYGAFLLWAVVLMYTRATSTP